MKPAIARFTKSLALVGLLSIGEASAATIFQDGFTRPDSQLLGCAEIGGCWVERNERFTVGVTPDGSQTMQPADIRLQSGVFEYHYPGGGGYSAQPYAYAPTSQGALSATLSFTLKPNGANRISHEVGLMTGAGGFIDDSPAVLRSHPRNSLAVALSTTCPTYGTSCIQIIKSDNGVQTEILAGPGYLITPFYLGPGGSYDVTLAIANDTATATITDGSQTMTASAPLNGFMILLDQVYVDDEQSLVQSNGLSFDNFLVTTQQPLFTFSGFRQPVDNPPVVNVVKAGSAVPVKFSLAGDQGLNIFAQGYPGSQPVVCSTTAPTDAITETVSAGGSDLTYDALADQYIYVWKTDKAWADTCRQLTVRLTDGSDHKAVFQFKK